jgi:acetate kinase
MQNDAAILVINCGSSSVKFSLFGADRTLPTLFSGALDGIGLARGTLHAKGATGSIVFDKQTVLGSHEVALSLLIDAVSKYLADRPLLAVGHRVVHGGAECDCPLVVTRDLEERLRQLIPLAPLHLPHNLAGIAAMRKMQPNLQQIACFDTAFHHSRPRIARLTGLPRNLQDNGLQRYGFHGLSYESTVEALRQDGVDVQRERIVVAHLGNGASMCALKNGRSVETTMGFSTLAGLMMGTRCGDLDPGAVLYLLTAMGMTTDAVQALLYERSGLLGVSGISSDMRELLEDRDDLAAREAIDFFCYRAKHHLAALTAALGGLDRLVFTGGIGANAPDIREQICDGLAYLGITLDSIANRAGAGTISASGADVVVQTVASNEESMIARHVQRLTADQMTRVEL